MEPGLATDSRMRWDQRVCSSCREIPCTGWNDRGDAHSILLTRMRPHHEKGSLRLSHCRYGHHFSTPLAGSGVESVVLCQFQHVCIIMEHQARYVRQVWSEQGIVC